MFLGKALPTYAMQEERLSLVKGTAIFTSDALSSVAYATEETLFAIAIAGFANYWYSPLIAGLIAAGQIKSGLAIGSDAAQSKPHDALEYASASASASILLGDDAQYPVVARLQRYTSYSSDTPDFWRRDGTFSRRRKSFSLCRTHSFR